VRDPQSSTERRSFQGLSSFSFASIGGSSKRVGEPTEVGKTDDESMVISDEKREEQHELGMMFA